MNDFDPRAIEAAHQWVVATGTVDTSRWDARWQGSKPTDAEIAEWRAHVAVCGISESIVRFGFPSIDVEHMDSHSGCRGITDVTIGDFEQCRCEERRGYIVNVSAPNVSDMFEHFVWTAPATRADIAINEEASS